MPAGRWPAWTSPRPTIRWPRRPGRPTVALEAQGVPRRRRHGGAAATRIFGSRPGAYGAGLQALIDERGWRDEGDLARAWLAWGGHAYGRGVDGRGAEAELAQRLAGVELVLHNQDNREHDLLDSDDYYQFEGGLAATVRHLSGRQPEIFHNDHARPEHPRVRTLKEEIGRVVRGRAANPKWLRGVMRHGYKGAFEIAATVDYLFAFAATAGVVEDHHFDLLFDAYLADESRARLHGRGQSRRLARDRGALRRGGRARAVAAPPQQRRGPARRADAMMEGAPPMAEDLPAPDEHRAKMARIKAAKDRLYATKTGEKGLLIVHTGTGKGKSTAAWGLAMRCLGHGLKLGVVQFVKGRSVPGERLFLERFPELVTIRVMGQGFTWETQDREQDIAAARAAFAEARAMLQDPELHLVILDELNIVLRYDTLPLAEVLDALAAKRPDLHVVVTGRNAKPELIAMADLVTEMKLVKHPFRQGIKGQKGVEF